MNIGLRGYGVVTLEWVARINLSNLVTFKLRSEW